MDERFQRRRKKVLNIVRPAVEFEFPEFFAQVDQAYEEELDAAHWARARQLIVWPTEEFDFPELVLETSQAHEATLFSQEAMKKHYARRAEKPVLDSFFPEMVL